MTRDEVIATLGVLKTAFPRFYADMRREEMLNTIDLWCEMFAHEDSRLVTASVKNLINTFKFPPTVADVKEEMYKLMNMEEDTLMEVWNQIRKAIRNSAYNSYEEFEKLPDIAKRFVGSPNQLKEWALSESFNDGVVRGQFFKQAEILQKRKKDNLMMLPEIKEIVKQIGFDMNDMKLLN